MTDGFVYIEITCKKCGEKFHPYGYTRVQPPPYGDYKCPSCGQVSRRVFDPQIKREIARKDLGLPDTKAESSQIKAMQAEIDSLRARLDEQQGCIKDLMKRLDILIPEVRKQVAQAITEMIQPKPKEETKTEKNPLAR